MYRVEKLEGIKNYGTWKYAMKMLHIEDKLWEAVEPPADKVIDTDILQQALAAIVLKISSSIYVRTKNSLRSMEQIRKSLCDYWTSTSNSIRLSALYNETD